MIILMLIHENPPTSERAGFKKKLTNSRWKFKVADYYKSGKFEYSARVCLCQIYPRERVRITFFFEATGYSGRDPQDKEMSQLKGEC